MRTFSLDRASFLPTRKKVNTNLIGKENKVNFDLQGHGVRPRGAVGQGKPHQRILQDLSYQVRGPSVHFQISKVTKSHREKSGAIS